MKRLLLTLALLLALASPAWAAFSSVVSREDSRNETPTTSHTVALPASIVDGNFLEVDIIFPTGTDPGVTLPTGGWFVRVNAACGGTPDCWLYQIKKHANGAEGASLAITTSASVQSGHVSQQFTATIGVDAAAFFTSASVDIDPASLTPQGGARDFLWNPVVVVNAATSCSAAAGPASYSNLNKTNPAASAGYVATAERQLNASSTDPGAWGCTANGLTRAIGGTYVIFPQVGDAPKFARALTAATDSADGTNHSCTIPTGIVAGMLFVPVIDCDGTPTITFTGYTHLKTVDNGSRLAAYYRQADGAEDTAAEFTTSASEQCSCRTYTVRGHENPAIQPPEVSTGATGTSTAPDPDSITPTGGAKNYLAIAAIGTDDSTTATTEPSTYFQFSASSASGGSGHVSNMTAVNQVNGTSIDPGAATIGASRAWQAFTIVVHPDGVDPGSGARSNNWVGAWSSGG